MKKIFTFVCALAIALSASAVPAFPHLAKARKAQAPAVVEESYTITVPAINSSVEDGVMYYMLLNDDASIVFIFTFALAEGQEDIELGHTYTLDEMGQYNYWMTSDMSSYGLFTAATFTKTLNTDGKVLIAATATDSYGNEFVLNYDGSTAPEAPEAGAYSGVADYKYYAESSDVQYGVLIEDPQMVFYVDIPLTANATDVVAGQTYTQDDMDMDYTFCQYGLAGYIDFTSITFVKTLGNNGTYTVTITAVDTEGGNWTITGEGAETAVENVNADVKSVKTIINGQIIIERNGVRYNAQGIEVK